MIKAQIGVIGMGVMGANLARNFASKGISTAVFNRTYAKTEELIANHAADNLSGYEQLMDFVSALEKPRKMILMVQAGKAVDDVIAGLLPLLESGDVIIDGGNSYYEDTLNRANDLKAKGLHFVGMGISGGEEGALHGPSLMPGGSEEAWASLKPLLEKIAAKDFDGGACVTHVGTDGAGHYVKMVHNGIEYAIMQLMAEMYDFSRKGLALSSGEIAGIFERIQSGDAQCFLAEIAIPVLKRQEGEEFLLDKVLDKAAQKGTGGWTAIEGLKRGVPISTISEAVFARSLSSFKGLRLKLAEEKGKSDQLKADSQFDFEKVMLFGLLIAYAQGLHLIKLASEEMGWKVNLAEVCRIWQGGCIIRSKLLKNLRDAFVKTPGLEHLFLDKEIAQLLEEVNPEFRKWLMESIGRQIALPVGSAMIAYLDGIYASESPANLIQGLRDFFGAHTFERVDKQGSFHENWNS